MLNHMLEMSRISGTPRCKYRYKVPVLLAVLWSSTHAFGLGDSLDLQYESTVSTIHRFTIAHRCSVTCVNESENVAQFTHPFGTKYGTTSSILIITFSTGAGIRSTTVP